MYLTGYVKKFGNLSFKEKPFNDIDACILATAVYSNLEVVAPTIHDGTSYQTLFKNISKFDLSVVVAGRILVKGNKKLIPAIKASKRFGNIGIKYVYKVFNEDLANQFYACTFIIPDVGIFVSFRGTDSSIIGWKENLNLSLQKVTFSQMDALDYLQIVASKEKGPIYIGGHSKGGNLTLYSTINSPKKIKDRIVKAYSFDGNGLNSKDYLSSNEYLEVKDKIILVKPHDSVVGAIMYNPQTNLVVKSKNIHVFQHDSHSWKIDKKADNFICCDDVTKKSKLRQLFFEEFINQINDEDKLLIIDYIMDYLGGSSNTIFDFFFSIGKLPRFIKMWRKLTDEERVRLKKVVRTTKKCNKIAHLRYKQLVGKEI